MKSVRHVFALKKGVSAAGTPYCAGTPVIYLTSDDSSYFAQSYVLTIGDVEKLLTSPIEPYFSPKRRKEIEEKRAATAAKRKHFYKISAEIVRHLSDLRYKITRKWFNNDGMWFHLGDDTGHKCTLTIGNGKIGINKVVNSKVFELVDPYCFENVVNYIRAGR